MMRRRLGVVGAGQVWRKLYQPALNRSGAYEVAGIADPVAQVEGVPAFASIDAMLDTVAVDCVAVLSPPAMHGEHVRRCIERGLPVLVEKPPGLSAEEVDAWARARDVTLVTPAFSRRYWQRYGEARLPGRSWTFRLETDPKTWGASSVEPVMRDLLPHAVDLARWLSGEEIEGATVFARDDERITGVFALHTGGTFAWEVAHGAAYTETLARDGVTVESGSGLGSRIARRFRRGVAEDVQGVAALLTDWAELLNGGAPERLPDFADARANVAAIDLVAATAVERRP